MRRGGLFTERTISKPAAFLGLIGGLFQASCATTSSGTSHPAGTDVHTHVHVQFDDDDFRLNGERVLLAAESIGLNRAIIISKSYQRGSTLKDALRENDFVAAEARKNPGRLAGACGVNPLRDWARKEIKRCREIGLRVLKVHTLASGMDIRNADDRKVLEETLTSADELGFTVLIHGNFPKSRTGEADAFLRTLERFPGVRLIVAHLLGRDFRLLESFKHPDFMVDVSALPFWTRTDQDRRSLVETLRKVGINRFAFGSDWPIFHPVELFKVLRELPLTESEIETIVYGNGASFDDLFAKP